MNLYKGESYYGQGEKMMLWTFQGKGFAIESTPVDHAKSPYYNDVENLPNVQPSYHRLFSELKTDKFLWCFPSKRFHPESEKVLYHLEVPQTEILAYICECVWHKIVSNCTKFYNQDCVDSLWKRKKDVQNYGDYIAEQNKRCFSKEAESQLLNRLFWPQPTTTPCPAGITIQPQQRNEMCTALIKSPIDKRWIVSRT